ncbi:MAG: hypothetical protein WBC91_05835 [Phototrophicaceae bacterium]|mgnify:CR=1 FL=1
MATERKEKVQVIKDGNYARQDRVVEYDISTQQLLVNRFSQLITLIAFVINIFLAIRIIMQLIVANGSNGFVDFIYMATGIFVAPFQNIVANPTFNNGALVDMAAVFAIVIYSIAAWILIALIGILFSDKPGTRQVTSYEKHS